MNKLSSKSSDQWPKFVATSKKVNLEGGDRVYQCQILKYYDETVSYYSTHHEQYCITVTSSCLRSRLAWSDLQYSLCYYLHFGLSWFGEDIGEENSSGEGEVRT